MAAACTSMEIHDRRLAISKASASKISKPSASPVLKGLSASASASASSPASSSPPRQLPSSITSSPSRPIAKVVNADPSSFRRVVQELTGTTTPSLASPSSTTSAGTSPRLPSRLQRIAPPPLRAAMRNSVPEHQQQQTLLEQMQQQRHQASQMFLLQQHHMAKVGPLSSPPLSFPDVSSSNPNYNTPQFGKATPNHGSEPAPQIGNPNSNFSQSLPMLSPHLLSPLPALTPGDSTWANPIEALAHSPKLSTSSSLPPLLPLPNLSTSSSNNGYGNGLLAKPTYTSKGLNDGLSVRPLPGSFVMNSVVKSEGQPLPPLLSTPLQTTGFNGVLPPWSPSPLPFSPGSFPPSPGLGPPTMPQVNNGQFNAHFKYGSNMNPNMSNNFNF
ncbi:hypothetical protein GOP47_0010874 [Adiantum capillus-veneris]|uniref:VQ domain-containing protein n=1 Tax=Adiantum capillus-veneris TaxID=13818 RepID=A0A9D4UWP4_ADICA|nr:hypothetical protein GOP47_0010874 [Adiantum capillus-veneris]